MCSRPRVIVSSKTSCVSRVVTVVARVGSCARVCMERALSPAAFFHVHFELQEKKRAGATAAPPAGKRVRQDCGTAEKKTQKCFGRGCNSKKGRTRQRRSSAKQSGKSQTDVQHLTLLGGALYAPTKRSGSGRRLREHDCREQLNGGCLRKLTRLKPAWGGGLRVPPPALIPRIRPCGYITSSHKPSERVACAPRCRCSTARLRRRNPAILRRQPEHIPGRGRKQTAPNETR